MIKTTRIAAALLSASALTLALAGGGGTQAQPAPAAPAAASLETQFQDPPNSARPRVWWHWMNGNISKDGIAKDLAWMKKVGIGGMQNFDANIQTPQIVDKRLVYMTPEWKDAFRFATSEAQRLGLEMAIASSPGWSETGGPWVKPQDGLKKLVWSETLVAGGKPYTGKLAAPPTVTGPFLGIANGGDVGSMLSDTKPPKFDDYYADVAVLAVPLTGDSVLVPKSANDGTGKTFDISLLSDDKIDSGAVLTKAGKALPELDLDYGSPRTVQSATFFAKGMAMLFFGAVYDANLEASDDGKAWRPVGAFKLAPVPTTIAFAPVTARYFRVHMSPAKNDQTFAFDMPPGLAVGDLGAMMPNPGASKPVEVGDLRLFAEPRIDRFETKAGFDVSQDYYALSKGVPEAGGPLAGQVVNLTDKMKPDGTLDWTPPKLPNGGRWRILRLGYSLLGTMNHPATPEATGLEVDKFDGPAVRRYLETYLDMYKGAAGSDLIGNQGVRALLTDSIEVGAANWTPAMVEKFKELRGYDPTPWLPALTGMVIGSREQSDKFLFDFRRTLADLMASEHYGTIAKVAHEHGLIVYGEALEDHRPSLGDDMAMRRYTDVPMSALWTFTRKSGPRLSYLADMKGAASVAHVYGQNLVAAESMTAAMNPWNYAPANLRRIIDLEFVTGINRPVIHTSVHVPVDDRKPGLSLFIFGQYFNRNESWADLARPWVDYIARNSLLLQQGRNEADVAYFYGEEAPLTGLYGDQRVPDAPKTVAYDFVNADVVAQAMKVEGNELVTPGGARYKALYLGGSSRKMTLATLKRIADLADQGATVVGMKPEGSPSLSGADAAGQAEYAALVARLWPAGGEAQIGRGRVIASSDVDAALGRIGVGPDFACSGAEPGAIPFIHRKLADGDSYFVVNPGEGAVSLEARFRVTGKAPELWHADTGRIEPVSYRIENGVTVVPLTLAGDESVHVVFRKATTSPALTIAAPVPVPLGGITGPWTVAFQPDRGAPASATFVTLAPLDENADPGIKYFSGIATYGIDFQAPKGWKKGTPLWLDLGEVHEVAEVAVNGGVVGGLWHAPYRIDVSGAVKPGKNHLEVRVANLWINRLVGDAQPGAKKVTWTAMPTYTAKAPLRRSGLIGPVTFNTVK